MTKPPALSYDLEYDLRALEAMAANLTPYLYENEVFGTLPGDLPRLTLGGLLMRLYRLGRLDLDPAQRQRVSVARAAFERDRDQWLTHYENKLRHELRARLDALHRYLAECASERHGCAAGYPTQAEKRTMIEHLRQALAERNQRADDSEARLAEIDRKLRRLIDAGDFVSDERLKSAYSPDEFWWLYASVAEA